MIKKEIATYENTVVGKMQNIHINNFTILTKFGNDNAEIKLREELKELQLELDDPHGTNDTLASEMADVLVCINQIAQARGISYKSILDIGIQKQIRCLADSYVPHGSEVLNDN